MKRQPINIKLAMETWKAIPSRHADVNLTEKIKNYMKSIIQIKKDAKTYPFVLNAGMKLHKASFVLKSK